MEIEYDQRAGHEFDRAGPAWDGAPNKISSPGQEALGDSSLDDVSGGLWPYVISNNSYNKTI